MYSKDDVKITGEKERRRREANRKEVSVSLRVSVKKPMLGDVIFCLFGMCRLSLSLSFCGRMAELACHFLCVWMCIVLFLSQWRWTRPHVIFGASGCACVPSLSFFLCGDGQAVCHFLRVCVGGVHVSLLFVSVSGWASPCVSFLADLLSLSQRVGKFICHFLSVSDVLVSLLWRRSGQRIFRWQR